MYTTKIDAKNPRGVVVDDMILTKDYPTAAGSKMLSGYMSLFDAQVLSKLSENGFVLAGKTKVGEFAIDLMGETACDGALIKDGNVMDASAEAIKSGDAVAAVCLDANGSVRRSAAQSSLISIKPTYGTVSRYGVISAACSGDTVSVMSGDLKMCKEILAAISGHDDKDGTSLPEESCAKLKDSCDKTEIKKVIVLNSFKKDADATVLAKLEAACNTLRSNGITVDEADDEIIVKARIAWNVLMCAELCNNVSRYDGVKYGYRAKNFSNLDELYTNSRTEAFGELLKTAILFGSETLSTDNYFKVYDKALRVRRVISETFKKLFADYDAVLIPACSTMKYKAEQVENNKNFCFEENLYTAPASITGLPAVVVGGVQLIGDALCESKLFAIAELMEKEGE